MTEDYPEIASSSGEFVVTSKTFSLNSPVYTSELKGAESHSRPRGVSNPVDVFRFARRRKHLLENKILPQPLVQSHG